jgi:multisubunit Na+/H+ antiporter MnhF subunit
MILGLILAAVFVYVGVNLEPGLNTTVATITTPTYSQGVAGLNGVIMIVFAAMIIFGIVKQMASVA